MVGLAQSSDIAATAALNADILAPGLVMLVMFLGGAWHTGAGGRYVALAAGAAYRLLFMLAFAVMDFVLGWGIVGHLASLIGFAIVAVAVIVNYSRR